MDERRQPSALAYQPSGSSRSWSHGMCREDARQPLPSELDTVSHPRYIIAARDKRSVRYIGKGNHGYDVGAIRTDRPCPARCALYYFEATVLDAGERGALCIGLAGESFSLHRQPGWEPDSFGYHAEDGRKYTDSERGEVYGPAWGAGDVVGCGLVNATRSIFFTRNGQHLGVAFSDVPPQLYPTVGLHSPNEAVALNFGEAPFAFDARGHVAALRRESEQQAALHHAPAGLVAGLVRSYLLHHAFADTLEALERDSRAADMDVDAAAGAGAWP